MATLSDNKTLNCPVCFERYNSPRVLSCLHVLCEKCLDAHVRSQVGNGTECVCPLCNSSIVLPDPKLSVDKWAKSFPLQSMICSLLESAEASDNSESTCEPCKTDGETVIADVWCTDCRERMCNTCGKSHKRNKHFKRHNVIPIGKMENEIVCDINVNEKCGHHHSKEIEFFCVDHNKLCCSVCIVIDNHKQCNDVRSIDDIARRQTQQSTSPYLNIISDIKEIKIEVIEIMSLKTRIVTEILKEKQEIMESVDKRLDTIISDLNKLRNEFKDGLDHLYKKTESSVLQNQKILQSFMTNIENSEEILQTVEKNGSPRQKFTTFENTTTQITSHYQQLKSRLSGDTEVHLCMDSSNVLSGIERAVKSLDTVQVSTKPCRNTSAVLQNVGEIIRKANSRTNIKSEMCAAQVQKRDLMTSPVTFGKTVTAQKLGRGTYITGGTYCFNGRLLMVDRGNNRLLQLDDECNVVKEYKINGLPTDVTAGNKDNEIFIAVNTQYIFKCVLNTDLTMVSRIKAPRYTWGIAASGDKIIAATPIAVVILKQDGRVVKSIPRSGDFSYVVTSQSQQTICHTDKNDVVCRALDGKELFRYQHQDLREQCCICVDKDDNLYTCGSDSRNVHQVSLDTHSSRIIVDNLHSISVPRSVLFHPRRDELM